MDIKDRFLVTGATGYLGQELIKRLFSKGFTNLVAVARNEGKLIQLQNDYPTLKVITGDIADPFIADKACRGVKGIFHLAAFKFVGLAETETRQCVESNVVGTLNLLEAVRKYEPEFIIGVSTDKAALVKGVYGATKLLMEGLFREYEKIMPATKFRTVRYGNVMGSTGSFLTKWKPLMEQGKEVIITDPEATRFFWTVDEAVDLIFNCLDKARDSTPFVPKMKGISMGKVLEACQEVYGKCPVKKIGLQAGENLHESMDGVTYSNQVEQYTKQEFKEKFL